MAHAQKPDFVFQRNGRFHLNRPGGGVQFSRLLAAEACASAVVMLDTPCSELVWRVLATHSIRQFPLHFPSRASPCAITFQLDSTTNLNPPPLCPGQKLDFKSKRNWRFYWILSFVIRMANLRRYERSSSVFEERRTGKLDVIYRSYNDHRSVIHVYTSWVKRETNLLSLALLSLYLMFNMFRMFIHPSSGACDLLVELLSYWGLSLHTDTTPPQ